MQWAQASARMERLCWRCCSAWRRCIQHNPMQAWDASSAFQRWSEVKTLKPATAGIQRTGGNWWWEMGISFMCDYVLWLTMLEVATCARSHQDHHPLLFLDTQVHVR
eukprot:268984-Pelagomonas_calceolata.AAC.5